MPGVVSGAEPDKSVGKYNPTETGIFPGDEAPTRALTEISGRVTSEAVLRIANDHYNSYKKYASSVNNFFGESKGYIIPKAQFVREFFSNIAATALQQGRELAPSLAKNAQDRLTEARADPDFASTDRRVRGDRREASGWLTPEARWQQTPEQNLARVQDVITSMPGWRGEALRALQASGALTVVSNSAALPGPLASEVAAIQAPGGRVGGLFAGGRAYIIADSTGSEFVFARALHEVGVHGGLQMLIGSAQMTALADRIRALATYTFEASAKFGAGRSKEGDNEVVAHFMENMARREARGEQLSADSKLGKLWADIKNGVTDGLKKLFNSGDIRELTAKEIYELALGALAQRAAPVTPIAAPLESAPAPNTPALKTVRRGRPPKPVDESVVGEANFDNDLKEAEIDALTARVAQNLKPPPPVNLSPVADALATINARGVPAEMELARRMAAVGDSMLNGTLRQMAKNPEKYTQYEDATDVRGVQFAKVDGDIFRQFREHTGPWKDQGVEFSVDYREALKPLNKTPLGDRLTYGYQAVRAALYDPAARAVDWFRTLPGGNQDAMLDEFRTAPNVYRYTSDKFREEYVEPILTNIRTIARQHGVTVDQVTADVGHALTAIDVERVNDRLMANDVAEVAAGTLTQAKAAQRVNSILAPDGAPPPDTANKELGVAGGMSNPQAEAVLLRFALKYPGSAPLVDAIQDNVYDMNSRALARSVETGMHTPHAAALFSNPQAEPALQRLLLPNVTDAERDAAAAAVRTTYVPMNSDAITVEAERADGLGGSSKLGGTAIQRAEGRGSLPLDGLNASLRSVDGVLRHAAYQPFKRLLALAWDSGLAANSNDPRKTSEALGFSLEKSNLPGLKGDVVYYRDAGRTQAFHWNDRNVGSAVSGSNTQTEGTVIGDAMRYVVRKFSALATVYNPFFSPPNALKDIGEKLLRIGSANVKDVMGMPIRATGDIAPQLEAVRYLPAAASASFRRFLGSKSQATQADLYLEEFLANGGSSLFGDSLKNGQGAASAIAAQAKDGYSKPDALIKAVGEYTTAWNDSFENISALMAYTYFRNHNATPKAAAAGALELMNFGKRGTLVKTLGTTIPFAGPALIGAANLVNDMLPRLIDKTDKSTGTVVQRRSLAGATTFAALVVGLTGVALAITADDEDKDPELGSKLLNGVPQSTLERSLPIKVGDMYVKAPIPFGSFMLAWGAAVEAAKYVRNEISGSDALKAGVVENAVKHLTPFKPPQFKAQDAPLDYAALSAAGIFTPLYTASTGATTFNPARQVPLNKQKTAAEQASVSTAPEYVAASDALRNVAGLDIRPAVLKQLVDGYSPGLLGMMKRALIDNPNKERQGKPTVNPLLSPYIMDAENPFAVSTKLKEYQLDAERAEREGNVKDSEWVKSVKSEDGRALRARKGVKDFATLARLDKAHEVEQRRLIAEYRRRHNLGVQQ